jgi:hypothetical protein
MREPLRDREFGWQNGMLPVGLPLLNSHKQSRSYVIPAFTLRLVQGVIRAQEQTFGHPHLRKESKVCIVYIHRKLLRKSCQSSLAKCVCSNPLRRSGSSLFRPVSDRHPSFSLRGQP